MSEPMTFQKKSRRERYIVRDDVERVMGICLGTPVPIASLSLVAASHKQSAGLFVIAPCSIPIFKQNKNQVTPKGAT